MSEMTRYQVVLPQPAADYIDKVASERGISKAAVIRMSLGLLRSFDDAQRSGHYVGSTRDREALTTVFVGPV